jgi:hypothetical protein
VTPRPISRRSLTALAGGFAAGILAAPLVTTAAQATPAATPATPVPAGFVSTRVRTVDSAETLARINELVLDKLVPGIRAIEGYKGYVFGDVIDHAGQSVSVAVVREPGQMAAFDALAADFVAGLGEVAEAIETTQWTGDLLITGAPAQTGATPVAAPAEAALRGGYLALRVHTSLPGTDPRDFVPLATSGFLPIVAGLPGFEGYLWYPTDGGFVAISLFDSEQAAQESNAAAKDWAAEFLTDFTDGNPEIFNANVVYADLPILR